METENGMQTLREEALGIMERLADRRISFEEAQIELDALIIESIKVLNDRVATLEEIQIPARLAPSGAR